MKNSLPDNGGRRLGIGIDRRQFSYTAHIPERRSGKEIRSGSIEDQNQEYRDNLYLESKTFIKWCGQND